MPNYVPSWSSLQKTNMIATVEVESRT